jgi:hypothetical protein
MVERIMDDTGKQLEALVAYVEGLHLPSGFTTKVNRKVFNIAGLQVAEFDIEVTGKLGTTTIAWLIECRDRPSEGPAPGSWIEQLVGRRTRFKFNKVTAVSTTGFAPGAIEFAKEQGIELREVKALSPKHFEEWLLFQSFPLVEQSGRLDQATLIIDHRESAERRDAFERKIAGKGLREALLRSAETGIIVSPLDAFTSVIRSKPDLYDGIGPTAPTKQVKLLVSYSNDSSHYVVDTAIGPIRVRAIRFAGELNARFCEIPLALAAEYAHHGSGKPIAQTAAFVFEAFDRKLAFEMHKIEESGETRILLRNLGPKTC